MKTKHIVGTTAENDALNLPSGMVTIDSERNAVRFYDGQTVGGYEVLGQRAVSLNTGPGPETLIAGDMQHGFFGEVSSANLVTYEALATQIGPSAGTSQFNEESLWLKFALEGKILYVAKKPARYDLSWDQLDQVGAVYGTTLTVGTATLSCRLFKGANADPTYAHTGYDVSSSHGSEWNRLLYHVSDGIFTEGIGTLASEGITEGSFAQYTEAELVTHYTYGAGSGCWCQEVHGEVDNNRLHRGLRGVSNFERNAPTYTLANRGWRPVLELVS